jgi:hypothetical protein
VNQPLSADALRAALSGVKADPAPMVEVSQANPDLVASTMARYRSEQAKDAAAAATGRPNFRRVEAAAAATPVRANKYAGTCLICSTRVEEGAGSLDKDATGKWVTSHLPGQCPKEEEPVPASTTANPAQAVIKAVTGQVYTGVHPGIYTLETPQGHRTFRVRVQGTDDNFAPGQTIIEFLSGPDNTRDYTGFGFLKGQRLNVWAKHRENTDLVDDALVFLADPASALEAATCIRCNATLTTPESVAVGMGPTCRNKGW